MNFTDGLKQMRKYGGLRLAVEYCRLGLGWKIFKRVCWNILHGKHIKNVYYETNRMVAPILLDKYDALIKERIDWYSRQNLQQRRAGTVWFCWMQGKDNMPDIIRACYNSQRWNIKDREFKFIDERNWREYVDIPEYLVEKYRKGYMPVAMFTDLIRLELLIKYGGSWIDSTVLCTGGYTPDVLDADIFMYQYGKNKGLSNWFITSCTNNPILMVIRDVLHQYWREYDVVLDYYIFHLIFGHLMNEYPAMIARMPYADSYPAIKLVYNWDERFSDSVWKKFTGVVHFHKLTYRVKDSTKKDKSNYYNHILAEYLK